MTSERSSARLWLVTASLAVLASCSVREQTAAQHEATESSESTASSAAALEIGATWPTFQTHARYLHAGVEVGAGRALVCGGKDGTTVYLSDCELFQAQGTTVTSTAFPLPGAVQPGDAAQPRINASLTLLPSGGVLVAGGRPDGYASTLDSAVASRPIADWHQADDNPSQNWLSPEKMKVGREHPTATLLGTSVVVVGGQNSNNTIGTVGPIEVRTSTGAGDASWNFFSVPQAPTEPLLERRVGHTATLLKPAGSEARVLILGGYDPARGFLASGFIFSLENGIKYITPMPPAAQPRYFHTATLLDDDHGSVLVVGGQGADNMGAFGDAWRYDPSTDAWSPAGAGSATAPAQRRHHAAVRVGSYVIVAGGNGPGSSGNSDGFGLPSVQSYDWRRDSWSDLPPLTIGRGFLQLLKLSDTQIVASGGATDLSHVPNSSEVITLSPLGSPLSDTTACASGHQADGVCCESDCNGPCEACDAQGLCKPLTGTPKSGHLGCSGNLLCASGKCPTACDSTNCAAGFFCDANGQCSQRRAIGAQCDTSTQCDGAPCVDHVCCQSECSGSCEACITGTGVCRVLNKGEAPTGSHPACAALPGGAAQCAARCDGSSRDRCAFPGPESSCAAASCESGEQSAMSACDGQGACLTVATQCAPYACDATAKQCRQSCRVSDDCSPEAHCEGTTCVRCDSTACNAAGYQCDRETDQCKNTCQRSETDCAGSYYCHPLEHRCIKSVTFPASQLPACTMGRSRVSHYGLALAAGAWLLLVARRRRDKQSRTRDCAQPRSRVTRTRPGS